MPEFVKLDNIKITQKIGNSYTNFGILLLDDDDGAKVEAIEKEFHGNVDTIVGKILKKWVRGDGITPSWGNLVRVLYDINLKELAKDIVHTLQEIHNY